MINALHQRKNAETRLLSARRYASVKLTCYADRFINKSVQGPLGNVEADTWARGYAYVRRVQGYRKLICRLRLVQGCRRSLSVVVVKRSSELPFLKFDRLGSLTYGYARLPRERHLVGWDDDVGACPPSREPHSPGLSILERLLRRRLAIVAN